MRTGLMSGDEPFVFHGERNERTTKDFWAWAMSRLLMDGPRGDLAEYIVRMALGEDVKTPKRGWGECDVVCRDGRRIEVKCSSFLQEWERSKLSRPVFSIAKTVNCDIGEVDGTYRYIGRDGRDPERHSDVYIFCLFACREREKTDPLNLEQWRFYLMKTDAINRLFGDQRSVSIQALEKAGADTCDFGGLKVALDRIYPAKEQPL